jgi:pimeloyl-ACP methyl ester carboxylesterase
MTADEPRTPESLLPAPAEGREERVDLDGWDADILRWGATSSRRVVLLHGFTSHAHSWQHLASALVSGAGHEVVALDLRGHGRSGATDRYGTKVLVEDVRSLDALGWERAPVVGHSMGGATAFMFAARYPARADRIVVIDAGPEVAPEGGARIRANVGRPDVFASIDDALADARVCSPAPTRNRSGTGSSTTWSPPRTASLRGGRHQSCGTARRHETISPPKSAGRRGGPCRHRRYWFTAPTATC